MKHLLKLLDLNSQEIREILDYADELKRMQKSGTEHRYLAGKTLAMVFEKNSTRTRVSFETGIFQLGGTGIFLSAADSQLGRGEPICDTARVLSRYCNGIMIRTYKQDTVEEFAKYSSVPVINGLSDFEHPCQVLADLMTIREYKGTLTGLKVCYIGDGNNMANSIIIGCMKCGMDVAIACPDKYRPDKRAIDFAETVKDAKLMITPDVTEAARGADVLFTDVWASMGMESESTQRMADFRGYQINANIMEIANSGAIVQHCLPAHRDEEITGEVMEAHANEIFDEAENRLHVQKAVMVMLMK